MLAIGFGEAGSRIIGENMSAIGELNPKLTGTKVLGIFCFCEIRDFQNITTFFQNKVMVFVNHIADIVHSQTDKYLGVPNKNIGEGFLLVWKFGHSDIE